MLTPGETGSSRPLEEPATVDASDLDAALVVRLDVARATEPRGG